jgi:hypothetical protein
MGSVRKTSQQAPDSAADAPRRRPGRPPVYDEKWTKVTVVLFDRQITFLDELTGSIRTRNGAAISRAQLIRALVDALSEANVDLSRCESPNDVKRTLLSKLSS